MNKDNILHLLTLKSTWVIIIAQIGIILKELGILTELGIDKYNTITTAVLQIATAFGVVIVYKTLPRDSNKE